MKRKVGVLVLATGAVLAALSLALVTTQKPAEATFPGQNGKILFVSDLNTPENTNPEGDREIFSVNPDGSGLEQLTHNGAADYGAKFSPDGKRIVFESHQDNNSEIYVMNSDGTGQTRLTFTGDSESFPTFTPDGKKIIFQKSRGLCPCDDEIYVMNADGSGVPTNLTNHPRGDNHLGDDIHPAVSPDGKIAFASNRDGGSVELGWEIYTMNPDGTSQTRLTFTPEKPESLPTFSPDGKKIGFVTNRDGNYEIYTMNPDGTSQTNLSNNLAHESYLTFSPDGKQIAFTSTRSRGGCCPIYTANADGTSQTTLTSVPDSRLGSFPTDWGPLPTATNTAPKITNPKPAPGGSTKDRTPRIGATIKDSETDLAKTNIVGLKMDGRNITSFSYNRDTDRLNYTPNKRMALGKHTVRITAKDPQGLIATKTWSFKVVH